MRDKVQPRVHYLVRGLRLGVFRSADQLLCGRAGKTAQTTEDVHAVTCQLCKRQLNLKD